MRNNKLIYCIFFTLTLITFVSCGEQDNVTFDGGQTLIQFSNTETALAVEPTGVTSYEIQVEVTTISNTDRTVTTSIDSESTAVANQYTISNIVIPAGEYTGTGEIVGNYSNLPAQGEVNLIVSLTGIDGNQSIVGNGKDKLTVTMSRFCPFDIDSFVGAILCFDR